MVAAFPLFPHSQQTDGAKTSVRQGDSFHAWQHGVRKSKLQRYTTVTRQGARHDLVSSIVDTAAMRKAVVDHARPVTSFADVLLVDHMVTSEPAPLAWSIYHRNCHIGNR